MALTSTKQRQEIGNRLKEERERLGYSEIQIAQLLGIPIDAYIRFEEGLADPGIYRMPRLSSIGFDVLYIITEERHIPGLEEDRFFRNSALSLKGKVSVFNTIDALERLAPNLKRKIRSVKRSKTD